MLSKGLKPKDWRILRSVVNSPFILAIPIALIILILVPDPFPRYTASLDDSGLTDKKGGLEYYEDLDGNGSSERVIYFNNTRGKASIKIIEADGQIGEHFYFPGQIIQQVTSVSFGEKKKNGERLIFAYSISIDSLFLNVVSYSPENGSRIKTRFIDRLGNGKECCDFVLQRSWCTDIDNDGLNDFVGGILAGFSLQPRHWFIYDLSRDSLVFSPEMGVWFDITDIVDLNHDGKKEILTGTYSISNYPDSLASLFDDHSAWIMVFDHRFRFLFPPRQFKGKYVRVITQPVSLQGNYQLITLIYQTAPGSITSGLMISEINGRKIRERELPGRGKSYQLWVPVQKTGKIYLCSNSGVLEQMDLDLRVQWTKQVTDKVMSTVLHHDFDDDGKTEHLCTIGSTGQFTILREDYSHPVLLNIPMTKSNTNIGKKVIKNSPPRIFIQQEDRYYLFTYGKNPVFYMKYLFYAVIYILILSIILLSQYFQRKLFSQRYEAEKQISALQLEFFQKQFDPHFAFNLLNTLSATATRKDPENVQRNLQKMATLMRSSISSSGNLSRSLAEELSFTSAYLDLVKISMEDKLQYEIMVEPAVDLSTRIPRMIVQAHTENAVKHGIRPRDSGGRIFIGAALKEERLVITIQDDGIGRENAATLQKSSTGKGMEIMDGFLRLFNQFNKQKILYSIEDLYHENREPAGTRVIISIPTKYNYRLFENK